jgi:hypothetical protein
MEEQPRYVWDEDGRGVWDNIQKCWVLWTTSTRGFEGTEEFKRIVMAAINGDPTALAYRTKII